jgi:hypothetical protein
MGIVNNDEVRIWPSVELVRIRTTLEGLFELLNIESSALQKGCGYAKVKSTLNPGLGVVLRGSEVKDK